MIEALNSIKFGNWIRHFRKGRGVLFLLKKTDFKAICLKKNQKIQRCDSKRKLQNKVKKNVRDEMGNVLLKHVFTSLWLRSKRSPGSAYVLIIADFVFIINSCLMPIHFVKSFFFKLNRIFFVVHMQGSMFFSSLIYILLCSIL